MSEPVTPTFFDAIDLFGRSTGAVNLLLDYWYVWVLALIVWRVAAYLVRHHALLQKLDERADAAFADVDALLSERRTLTASLAEVVRSFTRNEREVIREVLDARVEALEALGDTARNIVENQFAVALNNLFSVAEYYPQLAATEHYRTLRQDLIRIEERVTAGRKFYNLAVEESNALRRAIPGRYLAAAAPARAKFSVGEQRPMLSEPVEIKL